MKAIDTWRVTSADRDALAVLAELYGGEVKPWNDPKASPPNQFEVITESSSIAVWLPPDTYTVSYELWGGGGLQRRCDGTTCHGFGQVVEPCVCNGQEDGPTCRPYSRVNVILPEVQFGGVWRLETKSWNFAHEAPGMIAAMQAMQADGLARVSLVLTKRQTVVEGRTKKFVVPTFKVDATPTEMVNGLGMVRAGAVGAAPRLALASGEPEPVVLDDVWHQSEPDEDIVDADVVEDMVAEPEGWDIPPPGVRVRRNPDKDGPRWIRKT